MNKHVFMASQDTFLCQADSERTKSFPEINSIGPRLGVCSGRAQQLWALMEGKQKISSKDQ